MNSLEHDRSQLGAYALGALDPRETRLVHDHLAGCPDCRREVAELTNLRAAMDEVPPEAFLDGPPDGGDLLLRRTVRAARAELGGRFAVESEPQRRRPRLLVAASFVILVAAALGAGLLVGRETAPEPVDIYAAPNVRHASVTDPATNVRLAVDMLPQAGWVRLRANAQGIPAGERCQIRVVPRSGAPVLTGSWVVSERGSREGTTLEGSALVNPADVASVEVINTDGRRFVEVRL